jgi:sugar/nucleoside kinase (ribokinase family)
MLRLSSTYFKDARSECNTACVGMRGHLKVKAKSRVTSDDFGTVVLRFVAQASMATGTLSDNRRDHHQVDRLAIGDITDLSAERRDAIERRHTRSTWDHKCRHRKCLD